MKNVISVNYPLLTNYREKPNAYADEDLTQCIYEYEYTDGYGETQCVVFASLNDRVQELLNCYYVNENKIRKNQIELANAKKQLYSLYTNTDEYLFAEYEYRQLKAVARLLRRSRTAINNQLDVLMRNDVYVIPH